MSEECCNHNCNQGRDCPLRKTEKQSEFKDDNKVDLLDTRSYLIGRYDSSLVKELTDEEIKLEAKYLCHGWHSENPERLVLFARAILRKAQEK